MSIFKKLTLEDEMLQYLQKKYGKEEPFKILGKDCQSMFSKSHESKAISERFPNEVITIIKFKKDRKFHIEDDVNKKEERLKAMKELVIQTIHDLSVNISYCRNVHDIDTRYLSGYITLDSNFELSQIEWEND